MKLPRVVETLDEIEEAYHPLYEERDGKFHLSLELEPTEDDKRKVSEAARKERKARDAAEKKAREAEEALTALKSTLGDMSPEEIKAAREARETAEHEEAKKKGEFDELLRKRDETAARKLKEATEPLLSQIEALQRENDELVTERDLNRVAEKLRVDPQKAEVWRDHMRAKIRLEVTGENGTQRRHNVVYVDEVAIPFEEWAEKYFAGSDVAKFFCLANDDAGGGAGSDGGRPVRNNPWKRGTPHFNRTEQSRIKQTNPSLAEKLMREAGAVR